jgi:hypothetical protein
MRRPAVPQRASGEDLSSATPPLTQRLADVAANARGLFSGPGSVEAQQALEEDLSEHERFLQRQWPKAKPSADGRKHLDTAVKLRERRLKWQVRLEIVDRLVSIGLKLGVATASVLAAFHYWPG